MLTLLYIKPLPFEKINSLNIANNGIERLTDPIAESAKRAIKIMQLY